MGEPVAGVGAGAQVVSWTATQKITVVATGFGIFMIFLDALIVNVALPDIQAHFAIGEAGLQWVVAIYSLLMGVLMMACATLSDRIGRRRAYLIGVTVFGTGSVLSGLAPSIGVLIAARAAQGAAAALVNVASLALVSAAFTDAKQRVRAIGAWTAIGTLGLALGPTIGGVLTQFVSWRAVFLVNIPVVVAAIVLTVRSVAESRDSVRRSLDMPGQVLFAVAVGALSFAVIQGQNLGWGSATIIAAFAAFVAGLTAFIVREWRTPSPMMDLRLFTRRAYAIAIMAIFVALFCVYGMLLVVTQYYQNVRGYSPLAAGLLILPFTAMSAVTAPQAGRLAARLGPRRPILAGQVMMLAGLLVVVVGMSTTVAVVVVGLAVMGTGVVRIVTPVTGLAMSTVPADRAGMGSGILSTQRGLGSTIGYAVLGAIVAVWLGATLDADLRPVVPDAGERATVVDTIVDDANPAAYVSVMGPGRPISDPDPAQEAAIRAAADDDFVQGIQLGLGVAALLSALVLVLLLIGFREEAQEGGPHDGAQPPADR